MRAFPREGLSKDIFGTGDEKAGAARLAPGALVARAWRTIVVVAREELALVDPQLTVKEIQLFCTGMSMRRVPRARCETHQHADAVSFDVSPERLDFDAWRDLFPFRLSSLARRGQHWLRAHLFGDAKCKAGVQ